MFMLINCIICIFFKSSTPCHNSFERGAILFLKWYSGSVMKFILKGCIHFRMGMAASVDASGIRGVSDLISAHMTQSTTMDVNLANHISEGELYSFLFLSLCFAPRLV